MFKLKCPGDERGISEVLGAILVLGMVIGVGSVIYAQYIQSSIHSSEADHMNAVGEAFIKLKSSIATMGIGQSSIANIPMNTNFPPLVPTSGEVGTISLLPGIAYHKGATSYTIMNNKGFVSGSLNALKGDDDNYLEVNQVIFGEKFPNTSGWTMHEVLPSIDGDAAFDAYGHASGDGTGSISVLTSGQQETYYYRGRWRRPRTVRIETIENAYWEHNFGNSLDNYPNVTLQAYFGKETEYSGSITTNKAAWSIEVENGGVPENETLYAHQENDKISYVGVGAGSGVTGNTISPTYPGSLQPNDLILLQVTVRDMASIPTTPAGFTFLYGTDSTGYGQQWIYYKFSDGTETGALTVTAEGTACKIARMYAFRNVALSSFTEGENFDNRYTSTIYAPSVTTTGVNRLAVAFVFVNNDRTVDSFTGESGGNWTEATSEFTTTQGEDGCVQLQTAAMATAGTISGGSDPMGSSDPWGVRAFALKPLIPSEDCHLLMTSSADDAGTNLSVNTASAEDNRELLGRFVYPLAGISTIQASTWNLYYRSWYSTGGPYVTTNSPTLTSGGWSSPSNAYGDGGGNAYITSGTPSSASQTYSGYGFNIPAGNDITSVGVGYDAWCAGISFIGSASSTGNNPTSGSFSLPSGWTVGDVAVFWWYTYDSTKTFTPPSGVTQKRQASSGGYGRIYIGYRQLQSGDTTFGWTSFSVSNSTTIWGTSVFRGVDGTGDPFEAESGAPATFLNTEDPNPPAVTTVSSGAWVIPIFGKRNNYSSISPPTNYTSAGANSRDDTNDASAGVAYRQITSPTTEDPAAWALGGGDAGDDGYVWTGALKPANGQIRVDVSWDGGTSWSSRQVTSLTPSETTYLYDVTSIGWTPAKLSNDNFRVRVDAVTVGAPSVVRLDWIPVTVTYTPTAAPVAHSDISIRIRKSDGTIRHAIAGDVADSDNITSTESTYSVTYKFDGYAVEDDSDYLEVDYYCHVTSAAPGTAYLKIDNSSLVPANLQTRVENVMFTHINWNTVLSYNDNETHPGNRIPYWYENNTLLTLKNGIENGINRIRAGMYADLLPTTIDTYLTLWTDEIALYAGPPFEVDTVLTSMPILAPENMDSIVENLAFLSNYSPAYYTLQIQNSDGEWENFADRPNPVSVDQNKVYWVETIGGAENTTRDNDPRNYIFNDVINIRITGYNNSFPFSLCLDYLNFQVNYKENSENYLASFYGNSGRLVFNMVNYSYPNQTYVYDDGAVIIAQLNSSGIASGGAPTPDLMVVTDLGDGKTRVDVNHFVLVGPVRSISGRGWSAIRATAVDSYYLNYNVNVPSVSIDIYTLPSTDQAWVNYLSSLNDDFSARGYTSSLSMTPLADISGGKHLTLTIQGNISYYEKVTEVQVQLA
jgi:hypothetical protein